MFHRVDDVTTLDGPAFFRLAHRLPAYAGVMQARVLEARQDESSSPAPRLSGYAGPRQEINPGTRATLSADAAFQGVFSFG